MSAGLPLIPMERLDVSDCKLRQILYPLAQGQPGTLGEADRRTFIRQTTPLDQVEMTQPLDCRRSATIRLINTFLAGLSS